MARSAGDPGFVAWTEGVDTSLASKISTAAADATYASATDLAGRRRTDLALMAKGGSIGTAGKAAVVSIRFDHHLAALRDVVWPLMVARSLPGSVGVVSRFPTGDEFSAGATWADLRAMVRQGLEVWGHSATHANPTDDALLTQEIVTSKTEIEAQGFYVCGWQMPGVGTPTYPDWPLNSDDDFSGAAGRLILANYPFSEGEYPTLVQRTLPHRQFHGLNHVTIEGMTVTVIQNTIKQSISYGTGIQLMLHPGYIGKPGYLTAADLATVLDFVAARRDAGEIEVLTATGLIAADPSHGRRAAVIGNPSFDPDYSSLWTGWNQAGGVHLRTTAGHTGANWCEFTTAGTLKLLQSTSQVANAGMKGGTFRVEAWVRATTAAATAMMRLVDVNDPTRYDETRSFPVTEVGVWKRVWWNTTLHPDTGTVRLELFRDPAVVSAIGVDDITITPI